MRSLTSRVHLGTPVAVAAVLGLSGWALDSLVERSLIGEVDRELVAKIHMLSSMVVQERDELDIEFHVELDLERRHFLDVERHRRSGTADDPPVRRRGRHPGGAPPARQAQRLRPFQARWRSRRPGRRDLLLFGDRCGAVQSDRGHNYQLCCPTPGGAP